MEVKEFIKVLSQLYLRKDVSGIINSINEYKSQPGFQLIYRKLLKSNLISESSSSMDGVIKALLKEISQSNEISRERHTVDNFFETGERLKAQYSKALADIYLETQFPSDFIVNARKSEESGAELRLTDSLVTQYKDELIRIKKGLTAIIRALQPFSNFPIKNCLALNDELTLVFAELRTNYKYLLIKPYLLKIIEVGSSESTDLSNIDKEIRADGYTVSLFQQYINRGEEPELTRQVDLHLAIKRLFIYIKKNDLMDEDELREYWLPILSILNYKSKYELTPQDEDILINLLRQVNKDYSALLHKLSLTFVDEYHASQDLMKSRYRMIRNELIYTIEYLGRINRNKEDFNPMHAAKIELAKDKLFFLQDIFTVTDSQLSKAANVNLLELEKAAFGITTEITPIQLKEWIRIYSIIFSNASYVRHSDEKINFTEMRELISHLTTYHLIQNITQLKGIIDRNLVASDEERENRFKLFNEALKLRLQGLISTSKSKDKSFQEMIEELGFIQNKKVQFVIADTFKGFQTIADAFNDSANDYFVEDREAIIKESRTLYNDICNQCLKGLVARPKTEQELEAETEESHSPMEKKSWFSRLFAT
ncbi:MAG: hypothetical protein ABW082_01575 [Sedimenticola sp.]